MSADDSLLPAMLTAAIPPAKRSTIFGAFYTGYAFAWFSGSATMGFLYDKSILALVFFRDRAAGCTAVFLFAKGR
jgi:hypothetical protein